MCGCKINNLMKDKPAISMLSIFHDPLALLTPLASLAPIICSVLSFINCFAHNFAYPDITGCFGPFFASKIALDACAGRMCMIRCWAVISVLNASPRPNRASSKLRSFYNWREESRSLKYIHPSRLETLKVRKISALKLWIPLRSRNSTAPHTFALAGMK